MGRKIYDEDLRLNLILNGQGLNQGSKQMVAELGKMELKMIRLEQTAKSLAAEIKLLEKDEIGNASALVTARKAYNDTTTAIRAQSVAIEKLRQQVGLAGMTVQQLKNHAKALQIQLNNMTGNPALRQRLLNDLNATNARIRTLTTGAGRLSQAWERIERTASRAGSVIGMFTMVIYTLVRLVTGVITRMKELEDLMGTVRKNTGLAVGEVWEMKDAFDAWDTRTKTDDLLKLAIVAGKLGIEGKDSIMQFVESANMIQIALGDDLEGSVEDTVNSLGKLMNAFRVDKEMPINEAMLRTGGVLNQLAKSSAASAGTILNYMTRLSSVGELAGFTIAQIGGLGSALDAMNVPSERGATAVQKIMLALANPKKINDFADALGLSAEGYRKMLKDDPNKAMIALLRRFVSTKDGLVELTGGMKDFGAKGQYMTAVIGSLAQNLDVLVAQQEIARKEWENKIAGASVLEEYIIMNNNFTANVLKQQKIIKATTDQMNKDAEPAVLGLVTAWSNFVVGVKSATDWIGRNWQMMKYLTFAYILFKGPAMWRVANLILEDLWLRKTYAAEALKVFWMKASILWTRNLSAAQVLLATQSNFLRIANIALTQGFRAAYVEMKALRTASIAMAFPIVAATVAVAALAGAFYLLVYRRKALSEEEKRHRALQTEIQSEYGKEKGGLDVMIDRLKDVNTSQSERSKIIQTLKEQYGDYLPLLMKEGVTADEVAGSYDKIVEAMGKKVIFDKATAAGAVNRTAYNANDDEIRRMEIVMKKHQDATDAAAALGVTRNKQLDAELKTDYIKRMQSLIRLRFVYTDEYAKLKSDIAASAAPEKIRVAPVGMGLKDEVFETFKKRQDDMKSALAREEYDIHVRALRMNKTKQAEDEDLRQAKIRYLKLSISDREKAWRTEEGEEAAYMAAKSELVALQRDKQLDGKKEDKKEAKTLAQEAEAQSNKEVARITQRRIDGVTTDRQYNAELLDQELSYLKAKISIFKEGSDEYEEANTQYLLKRVAAEKQMRDLLLEAQNSLTDAKIANLEEGIDKERAIEEQRWKEEMALLKEKLTVKELLSKDEIAFNEAINATIEAKQKAHDKKLADLVDADALQKVMSSVMAIKGNKERFAAERAQNELQHKQDLAKAKGNGVKMATAEKRYADTNIRIKQEERDKRTAIGEEIFGAADQIFGNMAELVGRETALGRAFFLFQQASAIGRILFNTAIANSAVLAAYPGPLATPWLVLNGVSAAVGIASVLGQVFKEFSGPATSQKAKGSYPVIGADDGMLYHAVDGGRPATGVYSRPTLLNMSDGRSLVGEKAPELVVDGDTFRRIQLNAPEILRDIYAYAGKGPARTRQKASGSYPSSFESSQNRSTWRTGAVQGTNDNELVFQLRRLSDHLDKGLKTSINKYGTNSLSDAMNDIKNFNTKIYRK